MNIIKALEIINSGDWNPNSESYFQALHAVISFSNTVMTSAQFGPALVLENGAIVSGTIPELVRVLEG